MVVRLAPVNPQSDGAVRGGRRAILRGMRAIPLLRGAFDDLHEVVREEMAGVDPASLEWRAGPGVNTIGFLFWHMVRDEDVVISHAGGREQAWVEGGFAERLGLPEHEQGTGMDIDRAGSLRYNMKAFMEYAEQVWERTGTTLGSLDGDDLEGVAWEGSEWTTAQLLVEGCLGHSWLHLGEIRFCRGLMGWRGPE